MTHGFVLCFKLLHPDKKDDKKATDDKKAKDAKSTEGSSKTPQRKENDGKTSTETRQRRKKEKT